MTHHAKAPSAGSTQATGSSRGLLRRALATRGASHGSKGSSAPAARLIGLLAIALVALFATTAPASAADSATCCTISEVSYGSATAKATVLTNAPGFGAEYTFEYSTDEATWKPGPSVPVGNFEPKPLQIEGKLNDLKSATEYFVRVSGGGSTSPAAPPYPSFTTLAADPPSVEQTDDASEVEYTQVKVTGHVVRPEKSNDLTCNFEYITDTDWQANPSGARFTGATPVPCIPSPVTTVGSSKVEAAIVGLTPSTTYHLRLAVSNAAAEDAKEAPDTFTTQGPVPAPTVEAIDDASEVEFSRASVAGRVSRPAGKDPILNTECAFEYITDDGYQANPVGERFAGATPIGCEPAALIEAGGPTPVTAHLTGLAPSTTYHLRLVATNPGGPASAESADTFTTEGPVAKPTILEVGEATEVGKRSAQVSGRVERPAGVDPAFDVECNFEYVTQDQFDANGFEGAGQAPCAGPDEVQSLAIAATGGEFHLTYEGQSTADLPFDATADQVRQKLVELPGVEVNVSGGPGDASGASPYRITFVGGLAERDIPQVAVADGATPLVGTADVTTLVTGANLLEALTPPTKPIRAELGGLEPGTTYHLRLSARNAGGTVTAEAPSTFTTVAIVPPTFTVDSVTEVGYTGFKVTGTVDPGNQGAYPLFEYSAAGAEEWVRNDINQIPLVPAGAAPAQVSLRFPIQGFSCTETPACSRPLKPGTTYEVRLSGRENEGASFVIPPGPYTQFTTEGTSTPPSTTLQVTDVTATTAHVSGTVDTHAPSGPLSAEGSAAYRTDWHFECTPGCPPGLSGGVVTAEEGSRAIEVEAKNLEAKKHYEIKLVAQDTLATVESGQEFDTLTIAPTVTALPGGSDGEGGYTLQGIVNPNNSPVTTCEFRWGPDSASYAFKADCSPPPGEKGRPVTVEAHLTGLNPGSVYHADLVATNGAGTEDSKDFEFTPSLAVKGPACPNEALRAENNSLGLHECRAYEMVTYPNKEGASAVFNDFDGGEALLYSSNATNLVKSGGTNGITEPSIYVATRTAAGWETIPDLNGPTGSLKSAPDFVKSAKPAFYSADLLSSIWAVTQAGDEPLAVVSRRVPDGSFELVGKQDPVASFTTAGPVTNATTLKEGIVGASADLSHVVVNGGWVGWATFWGPGVYEFVGTGNDQPRRVDLDNSGEPITSCEIGLYGPGRPQVARDDAVSTDGRVIVVTVGGGCGGANPPAQGIWARVDATSSYDVSASRCDRTAPAAPCNAPAIPTFQATAKDGSRVYFTTTQQLVDGDTDETNDLYACDIPTAPQAPVGKANPCAALHEVSAGSAGKANVQEVLTVSDDGSTAYFTARGVLAGNGDALAEPALPGDENLYVWRTDSAHPAGQIAFVARLPESNPGVAQTTSDGHYLVLQTAGELLPTDTDESTDIYRYDAVTGELSRVSTAVSGAGGNGEFDATLSGAPEAVPSHNSHLSISDDGKLIVFATEEALSPLDGNGEPDAYLWNDGHVLGSVAPLVAGEESSTPIPGKAFIDGSGQDIYVQTAARLTATDVDTSLDVYDARTGGGFPQHQDGCAGETCQPSASAPPAPDPRASDNPGAGNPTQPKSCPKSKVKKHGKCVKKVRHERNKKHRGKHHTKKGSVHS